MNWLKKLTRSEKKEDKTSVKSNVEAHQSESDIVELGKLLRHDDEQIRQKSAYALLELLTSTKDVSTRTAITRLFDGIDEKLIVSPFMQSLSQRIDEPQRVSYPYDRNICWIILLAGGMNELIMLHQQIADKPSIQWTFLHQEVSMSLLEFACSRNTGIDVLLEIMPYGCCQYTEGMSNLSDILDRANEIVISREKFEEIKRRLDDLPDKDAGGLNNICCTRLTAKGGKLLKKLRVSDEKPKEPPA